MVHRLVLGPFIHQNVLQVSSLAGPRNFGPGLVSHDSARDRIGSAEVLAVFEELRDYITACRPRKIAFERPARGKEKTNCSFAQLSSSSNAHRACVLLQQDSYILRI